MSDPETKRRIDNLEQGFFTCIGSFDLAVAPATSTAVSRRGVSTASIVLPQAYGSNSPNSDIVRIVPAKDSFVVTHTSSATPRTYRYLFTTKVG